MFRSFFPNPKTFFLSALLYAVGVIAIWFILGNFLQGFLGIGTGWLPPLEEGQERFITDDKVWLYEFVVIIALGFIAMWYFLDKNKWFMWSVAGSVLILTVAFFDVQIDAYLNDWYGNFYDLLQQALADPSSVTIEEYYRQLLTVTFVLVPNIMVLVLLAFFISHYVFRWRTAMNEYYVGYWDKLRHVEGAAQRVQEDTMRFARIVEGLAVSFLKAVMTLLIFLPILWTLSEKITQFPIFGEVNHGLVFLAIMVALFGTVIFALVGIKLPGLEFENQKVEAAYRKELVYGEDHADRAEPMHLHELFSNVRQNYYRLYFHYLYFNVVRYAFLQGSSFVLLFALAPSIFLGLLTLGLWQQISQAFGKVEGSFQFLANVWTTIIDLISIYKRLRMFEAAIYEAGDGPVTPDMLEPAE